MFFAFLFGLVMAVFPGQAFAASDLVVVIQGPAEAARGQTVQYTVMVANNGPDAAPQVSMTSSTSYDFIFEPNFSDGRCRSPYGSVSCDLGLLPAGIVTNLTLAFTVRPLSSASYCSAQTVSHTASLSFSGTDPLFGNNSASVQTSIPCPPPTECNDGIDNDRDGTIDYNAYSWGNGDFGCLSANDRDERYPEAVCQDGRDNDGDGLIDFPWDPGCGNRQDNDEFNLPPPSPPVPPSTPLYSPLPLFPSPSNPPSLPATLLPQGSTPWLALPFPRCYNNVGPGYVEDIMIDLRCEGSKWGSGSGGGSGGGSSSGGSGGSGGGGSGNGGRSGGGNTGGSGGGGGVAVCTGNERAAIERTSDQREVLPGSIVRYTVVVRNTSLQCPLLNLILRNRMPTGIVVIDAGGGLFDGNALRWNIPRIEPGATHRISYSVRVPRSFSGDRFGGALSIDGTDGQIRDGGSVRVLRRFPKTGVDLPVMKAVLWIFLAGISVVGGGYVGWRLSSSP